LCKRGGEGVELAAVFEGDPVVDVRVKQQLQNGRETSAVKNEMLAGQIESMTGKDQFATPFDARHFPEYAYTPDGATRVRFVSRVRDASHGDGTFTVDGFGHVVSMTYTPDAFPRYATRGSVDVQRAQVLPNFWATIHQVQRYEGGYGFIRGGGTVELTQSGFRRFATRKAAIAAVDANRL